MEELNYNYEDKEDIDEEHEGYKEFLIFIEEYFKEENEQLENETIKKLLTNKNLNKAIPGGIYGCALLLKHGKRDIFKNMSLG